MDLLKKKELKLELELVTVFSELEYIALGLGKTAQVTWLGG